MIDTRIFLISLPTFNITHASAPAPCRQTSSKIVSKTKRVKILDKATECPLYYDR